MAKIYAYQDVTDLNTGIIDVSKLAKITAEGGPLTGDIAALGRIAGNFPDAFTASTRLSGKNLLSHASRSSIGGTLGGLAGHAALGDYQGAILGGIAGVLGGEALQSYAARKMSSPAYQKGLNIRDMRIPTAPMAMAAQAPIPQGQAIVPYQTPTELLMPGEGPYVPNWTPGTPLFRTVDATTQMMPQPKMLGAPTAEGTLGALRAEDVRRSGISRTLGQQAEAQQAAAEAASRKPATGEKMLSIDPITGKIREASQGIKGATPETFNNFGLSLETAASKVTAGKQFDLTAAERVAWHKTKAELAEVAPGFKAMTDKAVASKMLDREWVAKTAEKAREKAKGFDDIAKRAADMDAMREALVKREKLLDIAERMEESIRQPRPSTIQR
jgi:hypothetical protein